jgi:hypothetical protein
VGVLSPLFQEDFFLTVQSKYGDVMQVQNFPFYVVAINSRVYVNLVPLNATFTAEQLTSLQSLYQNKQLMLVHLWEDVWCTRRYQVLGRLDSFCGLNESLHGRKAKISEIEAVDAKNFLHLHHLQGFIKTKYNLGLYFGSELTAVACFAQSRPMPSKGKHYRSAELVRFATRTGFTIVGGLGRLIARFLKDVEVNDLMTYADRDWSLGKGYDKLGFDSSGATPSVQFYFDSKTATRYTEHRLPKNIKVAFEAQNILNLDEFLADKGIFKVFNTGNLKYHLYTNV